MTEYGADTIAGLHKLPEVIFSEEYQKRCIEENNKAMDECDFVIGEHIWAFADFMTAFGLKRVDGNKRVYLRGNDSLRQQRLQYVNDGEKCYNCTLSNARNRMVKICFWHFIM